MMKKILLLPLFVVMVESVAGQTDYARQYALLSQSKNTDVVNSLLDDWEIVEPQNVTMLVGQFNRYIGITVSQAVAVSVELPKGATDYMTLTDSLGNTAGYIYNYYATNDSLLTVAVDYVDRAIAAAPDRLDLRTGKIYAYWIAGDNYLDLHEGEILSLLDDLRDRKREWYFGEEGTAFSREDAVDAIQDYCVELFGLDTTAGYDAVEHISQRILEIFPKNAAAYSNLGGVAVAREEFAAAEKYYKKGLKVAPKDTVILRNLAIVSVKQGRNKNAHKYLDRLKKVGNEEDKTWAEQYEHKIGG